MTFYLLQRIQHHTHKDQQRSASEELGKIWLIPSKCAKAGMMAIKARKSDPGNVILDIIESINSDVFFPGLTPGIKPPFFFISSAI